MPRTMPHAPTHSLHPALKEKVIPYYRFMKGKPKPGEIILHLPEENFPPEHPNVGTHMGQLLPKGKAVLTHGFRWKTLSYHELRKPKIIDIKRQRVELKRSGNKHFRGDQIKKVVVLGLYGRPVRKPIKK